MIKQKYQDLLQAKNLFDNSQSQQGTVIHFQNLTEQDIELVQHLLEIDEETQQQRINKEVHRIFNQQYKRISVFTNEQTYHDAGTLYLGNSTDIECNLTGDFVQNTYFMCVLPKVKLDSELKSFGYVTNLGCSVISAVCKIGIQNTAVDYVNSQMNIILNNLMRRRDQRHYFNQLQGNTPEVTLLKQEHKSYKLIVPLRFFFSDNPQKVFRKRQANINKLIINVNLKKFEDLICYTRNVQDDIDQNKFIQSNLLEKAGIIVNEVFVSEQEQVIQTGNMYQLIEQNFVQRASITEQNQKFILNTFARPTKMIYFAIQKQKYTNKLPFLSYYPTIEGYDYIPQLLETATKRFVLKFMTYKLNYTQLNSLVQNISTTEQTDFGLDFGITTDITDVGTAGVSATYSGIRLFNAGSTDAQIRTAIQGLFKKYFDYYDTYDLRDGLLNMDSGSPVCIFSQTGLAISDQNKQFFDIEKVFDKTKTIFLSNKYIEQQMLVLGDLLSIEQASYPLEQKDTNINCFEKHLPDNISTIFIQQANQVKFSLYNDMSEIKVNILANAVYDFTFKFHLVGAAVSNQINTTNDSGPTTLTITEAAQTFVPQNLIPTGAMATPITFDYSEYQIVIFPTPVQTAIQNATVFQVVPGDAQTAKSIYFRNNIPVDAVDGVDVYFHKNIPFQFVLKNNQQKKQDPSSMYYTRGHQNFDIIVNSYDNFGYNIDKSGEILLNAQLYLSQNMVFNVSSFDMRTHILNYFPGRSNGASVYSFSLNPELIQPTGSLSFSETSPQVQIQSIYDIGDIIYIGSQIYNVMNYVSGSFALQYSANIGSE